MSVTITTDALEGLLYIYNGHATSRWNFPDAVGTNRFNPGGIGNAVSVTYSFLSANPLQSGETGFAVFDAAMVAATDQALASISEIANIDFVKVAPQLGQMTFGMSSQVGSSAYATMPEYESYYLISTNIIDTANEKRFAGDIWVNSDLAWLASHWQPGNYGYQTLLHEMGHALGLKHPFADSVAGARFVLADFLDNCGNTVMSYTPAPRTTLMVDIVVREGFLYWNYVGLEPSTMMMLDIEALQHLYGANMATRSGNTVYQWENNEELLETIWDGGGVDTLDCRNQTLTCTINLNDGEFSSIGLRRTDAEIKLGFDVPANFDLDSLDPLIRPDLYNGRNNLGIATGAIIENAIGGLGDDVIIGNDVANRLLGGVGKDKLWGGFGNDWLDGGNSADVLLGQGGNDILVGGGGADRMDGGAGRDLFVYNRLTDTGSTVATADVITGFVSGTDRIDLRKLDANATLAGNQAFTFIGAAAFNGTNASGQVRFEGGVLYGSTDADTAAEFMIKLPGVASLTAADLLL